MFRNKNAFFFFFTQSYFKFADNTYKDFMIYTGREDWDIRIDFNVTKSIASVYFPAIPHYGRMPPEIIYPLKIVGKPIIYGKEEIETRKIENILLDVR